MSEREDSTPGPSTDHPRGHDGGATVYRGSAAPRTTASDAPSGGADATAPEYSDRPVALRRPDLLAALLLVLAGVAAAISLVLRWVRGNSATGLDLVRRGFSSAGHLVSTGLWQPLAIVLGGGVLLVLGVLVFLPARSHRFLGALALLVLAFVVAALLVPFADAHWHTGFFDFGFWFACAVGVLGLLGSLKALLTRPRR
jgi:hypothetical protein